MGPTLEQLPERSARGRVAKWAAMLGALVFGAAPAIAAPNDAWLHQKRSSGPAPAGGEVSSNVVHSSARHRLRGFVPRAPSSSERPHAINTARRHQFRLSVLEPQIYKPREVRPPVALRFIEEAPSPVPQEAPSAAPAPAPSSNAADEPPAR